MEICGIFGLPIFMVPHLHQCNGYMKRKLHAWRVQECITLVVQIPYLPVRGCKVPGFMEGCIGPRMEICGISGLPILMVPRMHQSNGYMKRKLRPWRVQKCINLVGADNVLTSAGSQNTLFHGGLHRAQNGNKRNFGPTNPHGTACETEEW